MPRYRLLGGRRVKNRWRSKKNPQDEDNSTNPSDPPKNRPNEDKGKDPSIHTSNQRKESSAINLNVALDDYVLNESPPNELKNTTMIRQKILLLLWLIREEGKDGQK